MLESALKLLERMPEGPDHMSAELALRGIESTLAFVLHGASSPQRERAIRRLCDLGEKVGREDEFLSSLINLVQFHFTKGESLRGYELARRCLDLAQASNDPMLLTDAHWSVGTLAESCGKLSESALNYEAARLQLERVDRGFSIWGLSWDCALSAHAASAFQLLGRSDDATKLAEEALRRAHESPHLFTLGHTLSCAGDWLRRIRREPQLALAYADETIAVGSSRVDLQACKLEYSIVSPK